MGVTGWKMSLLVSIGSTAGTVPLLLMNGLETGLAMAAAVWMLVLADHRRLALLAGFAPYIRPELGFLASASYASTAASASMARAYQANADRRRRRRTLGALVLRGTGHAPSEYDGGEAHVLPNWSLIECHARIMFSSIMLIRTHFAWLFLGLLGIKSARAGWACTIFVAIFLFTVVALLPSAVSWNYGRYLSILVPPLLVGLAPLRGTCSRMATLRARTPQFGHPISRRNASL